MAPAKAKEIQSKMTAGQSSQQEYTLPVTPPALCSPFHPPGDTPAYTPPDASPISSLSASPISISFDITSSTRGVFVFGENVKPVASDLELKTLPLVDADVRDKLYIPCYRVAYPNWPAQSLFKDEYDEKLDSSRPIVLKHSVLTAPDDDDWSIGLSVGSVYVHDEIQKMENSHLQGWKIPRYRPELSTGGLTQPKKVGFMPLFDEAGESIGNRLQARKPDEMKISEPNMPAHWIAMDKAHKKAQNEKREAMLRGSRRPKPRSAGGYAMRRGR